MKTLLTILFVLLGTGIAHAEIPAAPTNITVTPYTQTSVKIRWQASIDENICPGAFCGSLYYRIVTNPNYSRTTCSGNPPQHIDVPGTATSQPFFYEYILPTRRNAIVSVRMSAVTVDLGEASSCANTAVLGSPFPQNLVHRSTLRRIVAPQLSTSPLFSTLRH